MSRLPPCELTITSFFTPARATDKPISVEVNPHHTEWTAMVDEAKQLGFEAMQYNFVLATNARAIDTWQRAGFIEIGRIPRAFRLPGGGYTDALILHRFL